MEDTLVVRHFVLFSCDGWSMTDRFAVASSDDLAIILKAHNDFLQMPDGLGWRNLAREAFRGRPCFFKNGNKTGGYLLFEGSAVQSYSVAGPRLALDNVASFSMADKAATDAAFAAEFPNGAVAHAR